jgi:adenylate cyclase
MAFWKAPLDDPEHAANALRGAGDARQLVELNRLWALEAREAGRSAAPVRVGIGINTGECCVRNFGSTQHFDYSLPGDPVDLASRLESLGKVYGVDLVIAKKRRSSSAIWL